PHIAEELWSLLGNSKSISYAVFPEYAEQFVTDDSFAYPISFNGKTRFKLELPLTLQIQEIEKEVLDSEEAKKYLEGKTPKKIIIVPKKIVNIVL
ncbi:MAG: class I tRNA ligase family protein, partial [Bacteroidia bacterium]|nr:class I tRNA ligase family protein [Bacteroidia bacterium]